MLRKRHKLQFLFVVILSLTILVILYHLTAEVSKPIVLPFVTECCSSSPLQNETFVVVHSAVKNPFSDVDSQFVLLVPFSWTPLDRKWRYLPEFVEAKRHILRMLGEFLYSREDFDAACCQQPLGNGATKHKRNEKDDANTTAGFESSWCRFAQRNWSLQVRNTGPVSKHKVVFPTSTTLSYNLTEDIVVFQHCNIVEGPLLIRTDIFSDLDGLNGTFGKLTWLEFFVRSRGGLRIAKLQNCRWSAEIARTDRGFHKSAPEFLEYAFFGNKHKILRIITENRIEWTGCAANWKLCPEKPYVNRSKDIQSISLPICCSVVLGQMLDDITWALNKLNMEYRVISGTLLGAVRSQTIIPWTYDVDLALAETVYKSEATYIKIQELLDGKYFVGETHGMPRAIRLVPVMTEVDTTPFFDGPHDLIGDKFFSSQVEESVHGMLPITADWRSQCYVDFYKPESQEWMEGYKNVTIDGKIFTTIKNISGELTKWYGSDYMKPAAEERWTGHS